MKPMRRPRISRALAVLVALAGTSILSGCGPTYRNIPIPGAGQAGPTWPLHAMFANALNLAQGAQVKVGGVSVGRVHDVHLVRYQAAVDLDIRQGVSLPTGTTARLRYDTPLGEVYVELDPPAGGSPLSPGSTIAIGQTSTAPTVEDTLASASLLINGGSLSSLGTITKELNTAFDGRQELFRRSFADIGQFVSSVNASRPEIDRALRAVVGVSAVLDKRNASIARALHSLAPAAQVLESDTPALVHVLQSATDVSDRAYQLMVETRTNYRTVITQLSPIIDQLLTTKPLLPRLFTDIVREDALEKEVVPGDYGPGTPILVFDLAALVGNPLAPPTSTPSGTGAAGTTSILPNIPGLSNLGGLLGPPTTSNPNSSLVGSLLGGLL